VIFYNGEEERKLAEASKSLLQQQFKTPIAVKLRPVATFYPAEIYHQEYYKKNPLRYQLYKKGSGREAYLNKQGEH
jgi:peptide methionine sulfoxide reductase MsrA